MIKRRLLLQLAGLTCAAGPARFSSATGLPEHGLRLLAVADNQAMPAFAAGDLLLADTGHSAYCGDGIYLYPHWGTPRPYAVTLVEAVGQGPILEFRNPGTGRLLWSLSPALNERFAGKLAARFAAHEATKAGNYSLLHPPVLPLSDWNSAVLG